MIISLVIRNLYTPLTVTAELAYSENIATQAIQNLVILLKLMYPKMHDGLMPNLEDLLKCFTNFDLVQEMCEELEKDPELAKEYELQLTYFKQYFYKNADETIIATETTNQHSKFITYLTDDINSRKC